MAISRRLRFEILRRDGHTCRYCGAMAPDVPITVDHVIPVALGGSDEPSNLVTACQDCNAGKSSIAPDAEIVEDVATDAVRWNHAIQEAARLRGMEGSLLDQSIAAFKEAWDSWTYGVERKELEEAAPDGVTDPLQIAWRTVLDRPQSFNTWDPARHARPIEIAGTFLNLQIQQGHLTEVKQALRSKGFWQKLSEELGASITSYQIVPGWDGAIAAPPKPTYRRWVERVPYELEPDWRASIERLLKGGLTVEELKRHVDETMRVQVRVRSHWRFFCGRAWRALAELQEDARRIIEAEDAQ